MVRGHTGTPARVCAVTIAVQHLLRSGDGGGTTACQQRRHHSRGSDIPRQRKGGRTGRDTAEPGAEGGMGNAVCRRCWDGVQIASRASENDDGYRGGIRCVWLDRVGEGDGDYPDAATGEGEAAEGDTNATRFTSSYTWAASLPKTPTSREISTAAPK